MVRRLQILGRDYEIMLTLGPKTRWCRVERESTIKELPRI